MDKLDKVLKLIDGGFTKDEIVKMLDLENPQELEDAKEVVQKNVQDEKTNLSTEILEMEEDEKNASKNDDPFKSMFENLNASVDAFNKKLQSLNSKVDELDVEDVRTDADIIAEIITPKGNPIK